MVAWWVAFLSINPLVKLAGGIDLSLSTHMRGYKYRKETKFTWLLLSEIIYYPKLPGLFQQLLHLSLTECPEVKGGGCGNNDICGELW